MKKLLLALVAVLSCASLHAQRGLGDKPPYSSLTETVSHSTNALGFVQNGGQLLDATGAPNTSVKFLLRAAGLNVQLRAGGFSYDTWKEGADGQISFHRVDVSLVGANAEAELIPQNPDEAVFNFFSDGVSVTGVHHFGRVVYRDIYPGIDLEFVAAPGDVKAPVEYNFIVHPGADASVIALRYDGAEATELRDGAIALALQHGVLEEHIPASWVGKKKTPLAVSYQRDDLGDFRFQIPAYDTSQMLVIDPQPHLVWGTFYGGSSINRVAVSSDGFVYAVGIAGNATAVVTGGAFQTTIAGSTDLFLAKFNTAGVLQWSTLFGSAGTEEGAALAVTPDGSAVYVGGRTSGGASPTALATGGVFQGTRSGAVDGFIAKFDNAGARLWSGYVGGPGTEQVLSLWVAPDYTLLASGMTTSSSGISIGSPVTSYGGGAEDGFIMKVNATGTTVAWMQYVGGGGDEEAVDVSATAAGLIYVGGTTTSPGGISTAGSYQTIKAGGLDYSPYIRKYSAAGSLLWGTYYNVSQNGAARIAADAGGDVFFCAAVPVGSAFPYNWSTGGAHQPSPSPTSNPTPYDLVLARFSAAGARLWGTYYGNDGNEVLFDFGARGGLLYLTGLGEGNTAGIVSACPPFGGGGSLGGGPVGRAFAAKFSASGAFGWGTYLAGFSTFPYAVGPEGTGDVYIGGGGGSSQMITAGALHSVPPIQPYTFLMKLDEGLLPVGMAVTASTIAPLTQTACILGWSQPIVGNAVTQTSPIGYPVTVYYQWQSAPSPGGPWTNIPGQVFQNLQPQPTNVTTYFRRIITAYSGCTLVPVDSSAIAVVTININNAPVANAGGGSYLTCPPMAHLLGGTPPATGGTPGYTYAWWAGALSGPPFSTAPSPGTGPITVGTTYTLRVIDANGCIDFDQIAFTPVAYNAGADQNYCLGGPGIQLGTIPEPSTTFSWTPAAGLSCTTCPNPIATPGVPTTYTVTQTVPTKGGFCTTTDMVTITPLGPPNSNVNFAGPDTTICRGGTATIGTPNDPTFFYVWSPSTYLGGSAFSATATFNAGGNTQPPCPMTYTLTAYKGTCAFTDQTVVSVINPDLDHYGPICGPVWIHGAGPTSCAGTVYTWSLVSGSGTILALSGGGANALLKNNGPGIAVFQRASTLNGITCTKQVILDNACAPGCTVGIVVLSAQGCAKVFPGVPLQLGVIGYNPSIYTIKWTPALLVSDSTAPVVTVLTSAPTTFTVTLTNIYDPTDTCSASILVNKPTDTLPVFNAPNVTTCPGTPIGIGLAPLAGYTYLWSTNPTLSCLPCSNPIASPLTPTIYSITMTNTTTGCKGTDTVLVTVTAPIANAGPDMTVCNGATVTLGTPDPSAGAWTYSWSPPLSPWQNSTNQNSAQPQVLYSSLVPLTYSLIVTDPVSGCQAFDTVVLTSIVATGTLAGMSDTLCPGDTVQIGAIAMPGYTYSWSPTANLSCSSCAQPLAYPPSTTTYVVSAITPGCAFPITDTVDLVMSTLPTLNFIDRTVCPTPGTAIGLGALGNPAGAPGVVSWLWSPASFLSCTACANPIASPSAVTTYYVTATTSAGCKVKDTLIVTPTIAVTAGADKNICTGGSVVIGSSSVVGVTYAWSPAGGLSCTNCAQPTASPSVTTTYYLNATNGPCSVVDSVVVNVGSAPAMTLNPPSPICSGNCTTIGFFGNPGCTYQWVPTAGLATPTAPTTIACPTTTTTYTLIQTQIATGCLAQANVTVQVIGTAPTATGSADTICAGNSASLILLVGPGGPSYSYTWTPPGGLNSPFIQNPIASPAFTTIYTVTVTNISTGCSDTASATVVVLDAMDCLGDDYGDLPGVYETAGVAKHGIDTALHIGAVEDGEISNAPAIPGAVPNGDDLASLSDEDGVSFLPVVTTATNYLAMPVSAYNNIGASALLTAWMDWNGDGDFLDPGETSTSVTLGSTPVLQFPLLVWSGFNGTGQTLGGTTYLRIRIHTSSITPSPNGAMATGEVEDYRLNVLGEDFGDASPTAIASASVNPDQNNDGAPDATGSVWLGARVDYVEFAPVSNPTATGDDMSGSPDDEDGVNVVLPSGGAPGNPFNVTVGVSSQGAVSAQVGVWIDFNGDGDFVDAIDFFQMPIVASSGSGITSTTVSTTIPVGGSGAGAITRVGVTPAAAPNFAKPQAFGTLSILNGEWEDNIQPGVPLGVRSLEFSARATGGAALLDWRVEGEENVEMYRVLRSRDALEWDVLNSVLARAGSGMEHYVYLDGAPMMGLNFYRLALVSEGGVVESYSGVAQVNFNDNAEAYAVSVNNGMVQISVGASASPAGYALYASNGAMTAQGRLVPGRVTDVTVGSAGIYLVRIYGMDGKNLMLKKLMVR